MGTHHRDVTQAINSTHTDEIIDTESAKMQKVPAVRAYPACSCYTLQLTSPEPELRNAAP